MPRYIPPPPNPLEESSEFEVLLQAYDALVDKTSPHHPHAHWRRTKRVLELPKYLAVAVILLCPPLYFASTRFVKAQEALATRSSSVVGRLVALSEAERTLREASRMEAPRAGLVARVEGDEAFADTILGGFLSDAALGDEIDRPTR